MDAFFHLRQKSKFRAAMLFPHGKSIFHFLRQIFSQPAKKSLKKPHGNPMDHSDSNKEAQTCDALECGKKIVNFQIRRARRYMIIHSLFLAVSPPYIYPSRSPIFSPQIPCPLLSPIFFFLIYITPHSHPHFLLICPTPHSHSYYSSSYNAPNSHP